LVSHFSVQFEVATNEINASHLSLATFNSSGIPCFGVETSRICCKAMSNDAWTIRAPRKRQRLSVVIAALMSTQTIFAQEVGLDICACQPSVYEFKFDFGLTCKDLDVGGPGINDTTCLTELRGAENQEDADVVPVTVSQISIFELDQNLDVIAQTAKTGAFLTGSTFTYTSIIATEPDMLNPNSLPRGIQLVFIGTNALNQAVVNTFAILYSNECGIFPLLKEGEVAGWSILVSIFSNEW
jgi:hypothetical protein